MTGRRPNDQSRKQPSMNLTSSSRERNMILGRFGGEFGSGSTRKPAERKRTSEERVLKSIVGHFKGGVLDVRHLLHSGSSRTNDTYFKMKKHSKSENRGGGCMKSKGKKKGGKKKKGWGKKKGK
ncbi:hypothetical protein ARALYDRAFT_920351 [Arabidopsis lyrata subsp. lyrata]|uniref:Uncharacterized protein n=1 Tax=Arabidopsis lyrata subsp. lyrata TaxID=81972 RepID=D7MWW6_ARALL|nr:hypothetical protein ARALYDRAFT_920351 [Arabidopsis lyrata subsp. lyrata]